MDQEINLIDLTNAFSNLLDEVNTMEMVVYGLAYVKDPYARGFNAIYNHLRESIDKIQELLEKSNC